MKIFGVVIGESEAGSGISVRFTGEFLKAYSLHKPPLV